jgi:hypothetical protein
MDYNIFVTKSIMDCIKDYFEISPFSMQAAFALAEVNERSDSKTILLSDFQRLTEKDYEYHSPNGFGIHSNVLLDLLGSASWQDRLCLAYFHSHEASDACGFENEDHKMIFRISYAYQPFGIHASLYYSHGELSGTVWLPKLTTAPLHIIHE